MNISHGIVTYGKAHICFSLLYVPRKTLEIAVHPDCSVVVKAPIGTEYEDIRRRVIKRARWIVKQIEYFGQFDPKTPQRQYVGGETHLYLGRQYRLKIEVGARDKVKLSRGYFHIVIRDFASPDKVSRLLKKWYLEKAMDKYAESVDRCCLNFEKNPVNKPILRIRHMKKRWGSLSKNGVLTLNVDLIRAPKECIDYVVTHELCHLLNHDHSPEFYRLLEKIMPDWEKHKHRLELSLI